MAKILKSDKGFKLIECSLAEMSALGMIGCCDSCNKASFTGVLIPVLNRWYCDTCFAEWHSDAVNYEDDKRVESAGFAYYKAALNAT